MYVYNYVQCLHRKLVCKDFLKLHLCTLISLFHKAIISSILNREKNESADTDRRKERQQKISMWLT